MRHYDFVKVQEMCGSTILYTVCLHDHPNVGVFGSPCDPDRAKALRECRRYCKQIGAARIVKLSCWWYSSLQRVCSEELFQASVVQNDAQVLIYPNWIEKQ